MAQIPNYNKLILLSGFSNYYDRKIFFYSSVSDYLTKATAYYEQTDINFNPNDGIDASVDLSSLDSSYDESVDIHRFSYLLVVNPSDNDIVSRWFIMDVVRATNGIYKIVLKRDVVAESIGNQTFESFAPVYVEKGMLDEEDPMIVNSEGISFNQIKKEDVLITEQMGEQTENYPVCYVVGYFANNAPAITAVSKSSTAPGTYTSLEAISTATGISMTKINEMMSGRVGFTNGKYELVYGVKTTGWPLRTTVLIPQNFNNRDGYRASGGSVASWSLPIFSTALQDFPASLTGSDFIDYMVANHSGVEAALNSVIQNDNPSDEILSAAQLAALQSYESSRTIVLISGKYYYFHVRVSGTSQHPEVNISKGESTFFDNIVNYSATQRNATVADDWLMFLNYKITEASIELEEVRDSDIYKVTIPTTHRILSDAPYSMFIIPFQNIDQTRYPGTPGVTVSRYPSRQQVLEIVIDIARQWGIANNGTGFLYDVQLLPFIPERRKFIRFDAYNSIYLKDLTQDYDFSRIYYTDGGGTDHDAGAILFPEISNDSFRISYTLYAKRESLKIESQTDFYRICSPNYNGVFEFNLAKNGGYSFYFYIDITAKPFNPFIRVTPQFKNLYGENYKDGRGLICGGDFSLPLISDAWVQYELQNKNYGSIFTRDIQNLEFQQRQEAFKEPFAMAAGAVGSGAAGALAGAKIGMGNPYAIAAGAAIGAGVGIVGGALDLKLNAERRAEQKDYTIDRFNLSLGNIKALPYSLAKSSAFVQTSKIFPFIEYYTCTDEEVEALTNKIKYDGMTVGRIDYIVNFRGGNENQLYFKGQVIRAEGIEEDNHYVATLYNELAKGVYF